MIILSDRKTIQTLYTRFRISAEQNIIPGKLTLHLFFIQFFILMSSGFLKSQCTTPLRPFIDDVIQPTCLIRTGSVLLSDLPSTGTWTLTSNPGNITLNGTGESATFAGLPAGQTYTFTVKVGTCISAPSGFAVIEDAPEIPATPIIDDVLQPDCDLIGGLVEFSGLPTEYWELVSSPGEYTSSGYTEMGTISGLEGGKTYTFRVKLGNCFSLPTEPVTMNLGIKPPAPTIGQITQTGCTTSKTGSVQLLNLPSGNWTLTTYPNEEVIEGSGTSITIAELIDGNTYYFTVNNGVCTSDSSAAVLINPLPTLPTPVLGTIVQPNCQSETGSVSLSNLPSGNWTLVANQDDAILDGTGLSATFSGLFNDAVYYFFVRKGFCESAPTAEITIDPQPQTPGIPIIGTITQPSCEIPTGSVQLIGLPDSAWTVTASPGGKTLQGTGSTALFSGLSPSSSYSFTVSNGSCSSTPSATIQINPGPPKPNSPSIGTITQPSCNSSTGAVQLNGLPQIPWTITSSPAGIILQGTGTSAQISGLNSSTSYSFIVNNGACNSNPSASAQINAQPQIPAAPAVATITQPSCNSANGSVQLNGLPQSNWTITASPGGASLQGAGTSVSFSGLPQSTAYTFTVNNGTCTSIPSAIVQINSQPITPASPSISSITQPTCNTSTGSVQLSGLPLSGWTITASPGGATLQGSGTSTLFSGLNPSTNFTFSVNNGSCSSSSSSVAQINAQPITPAAPAIGSITQPGCNNTPGSVQLNGLPQSGWTIIASPGGASLQGSGTSALFNGLNPSTSYSFTVGNGTCTSTTSAPVEMNANPVKPSAPVLGSVTQPSCNNPTGSVQLNGLPLSNWTITASPGGLILQGSGTNAQFNGLNQSEIYSFVVNDGVCSSNASAPLQINAQPLSPAAPAILSITQPTCITSTGTVQLGNLPQNGWTITASPGGAILQGSGTNVLFSGLNQSTAYTFSVNNGTCSSVTSASAQINTQPLSPNAPVISSIIQPTCTNPGGGVQLSGLPLSAWTITASPGGINLQGSGTSALFNGLSPSTTYTFSVNNGICSSVASSPAQLIAQPQKPGAPVISSIIQPTCNLASGAVQLSGLPPSSWTITAAPGGAILQGSTTSVQFNGLNPSTNYSFTINDGICESNPSAPVQINAQPPTPAAPQIGTITQPTCSSNKGNVQLNGLPLKNWTITASPGGITLQGSSTSTIFSGLNPSTAYSFTMNDGTCTSNSSAVVQINAQPQIPAKPVITGVTHPTCNNPKGSALLSGLPQSNWTITASPGGTILVGSGSSSSFNGLLESTSYSFIVNNGFCSSDASLPVQINAQPKTPNPPVINSISQPSCNNSKGSVQLSGLPQSNWTITTFPSGSTLEGSGTSATFGGLNASTTHTFAVNNGSCSSNESAPAQISAQPQIPTAPVIASITQPTCTNPKGSVQLSGLPLSNWTLTASPGGTTLQGSGNSAQFGGLNASATYSFTVNNGICTSVASPTAQINPQPQPPSAPLIGTITQPTCNTPSGSVQLNGLPASSWTITASPGGSSIQGSGNTANFSGLNPSNTYSFTVSSSNCTSVSSASAQINAQPTRPAAPVISSVTQPDCFKSTASVQLSGLPQNNWTITASPGGSTLQGSGTGALFSGLNPLTTYSFSVNNGICTSAASQSVQIDAGPTVPSTPLIDTIIQPDCDNPFGSITLRGLPQSSWILKSLFYGTTIFGNGESALVEMLFEPGNYLFTVNNGFCESDTSADALLEPQPQRPFEPLISSINHPTCLDNTGSVELIGLPEGNWTIKAYPGGIEKQGSGETGLFAGLNPESSYSFSVSDGVCESVKSQEISINPLPPIPAAPLVDFITQPDCVNPEAKVLLKGLPQTAWTITAYPGGATLQGTLQEAVFENLSANTTYFFKVSENECASGFSQEVVINPQPFIPATPLIDSIIQPGCENPAAGVILSGLPQSNWIATSLPGGRKYYGSGSTALFEGLNLSSTYRFFVNSGQCNSDTTADIVINSLPTKPAPPTIFSVIQPGCDTQTGTAKLKDLPETNWIITAFPGGKQLAGTGISADFEGLNPQTYYTFRLFDGICESEFSAYTQINASPDVPSAPVIDSIIQPTCITPTGAIKLSGLPLADWTITAYPGGKTLTGSGETAEFSGLIESTSYYFVVNNGICSSDSSDEAAINPQPETPDAPAISGLVQPNCQNATGEVNLTGLPSGSWTLFISPAGSTIKGIGESFNLTGLSPSTTYSFSVNDGICSSALSNPAQIQAQPVTPAAPVAGEVIQPNCIEQTASVKLSGLPSGNWTVAAIPSGITIQGSGTSSTISGLPASSVQTFTVNNGICTSNPSASKQILAQPSSLPAPLISNIIQPSCNTATGSVALSGLPSGLWTLIKYPQETTLDSSGNSFLLTGLENNQSYQFSLIQGNCISETSEIVSIGDQPEKTPAPTISKVNQPSCISDRGSIEFSDLPDGNWTIFAHPGQLFINGNGPTGIFPNLQQGESYAFSLSGGTCESDTSEIVTLGLQPTRLSAPVISSIQQPDCNTSNGTALLTGLPPGPWIVTALPEGMTLNGSGTNVNFNSLQQTKTYSFIVASGICDSDTSGKITINLQPLKPAAPIIGTITQPSCNTPSGSVQLTGLPQSNWIITASPGGTTLQGSGSSAIISGLSASTLYTFSVSNITCTSNASSSVQFNAQPSKPATPAIGTITHPTCNTNTGAVQLSGLPQSGWTIIASPGGATKQGTGTNTQFSGLNPSTSYTFTVNNGICASNSSASAQINAQPVTPAAPVISSITQPSCNISTGTVQLNGLPQSNWTIIASPGGATRQGSGTSLQFSGLNASASYTFTVNNGACTSIASSPALINAQPVTPVAPTITSVTQPTCNTSTGSVQLSGLPQTNWTITASPGGSIIQGSGSTAQFSPLNASTTYSFSVNNGSCTSASSLPIQINAQPQKPLAPSISLITQPTCINAKGSIQLSGLPQSAWTITTAPGGSNIQGSGSTYTISGLNASTTYTFSVNNGICNSDPSSSASINPQPEIPAPPSLGAITHPTCNTSTGSVQLTGLPASGWTIIATPGGASLQGTGTGTTFSNLSQSKSYTFTVNNGSCTSASSASALINAQPVKPAAPIISSITQPTCNNSAGTVQLSGLPLSNWIITASPGGSTLQGSGTNVAFSGLNPSTNYSFSVSNGTCSSVFSLLAQINAQPETPQAPIISSISQPTCIIPSGSIQLSGLPQSEWTISRLPDGKTTDGSGFTASFIGLNPSTEYTFTVSNGKCVSNPSLAAKINTQPQAPAIPIIDSIVQPTCENPSALVYFSSLPQGSWTITSYPDELSVSGNGPIGLFNLSPQATGSVFRVSDGVCESENTEAVTISPAPQKPLAPVISSITKPDCQNNFASVTLSGLPQGNWTIMAFPGERTLEGTGETAVFSNLTTSTTYFFSIKQGSCESDKSLPAQINAQPQTPPAPVISGITHPSCNLPTGTVQLGGLPNSNWTITASPGGGTLQGSGSTAAFSGLKQSAAYTFIVNNGDCNSSPSESAPINTQPLTPSAPAIGTITQPTCNLPSGTIQLNGLPSSDWTVTASPGGAILKGSGSTANFSGLSPSASFTFKVNNGNCISAESSIAVINAQPETPVAPVIGSIAQPTCGNAKASVQLNGLPSSNWTITASPGGALLQGSGSNAQFSGLNTSTAYSFVVNNGSCSSPASQVAEINAQPSTPSAPAIGTITQPTCSASTGSVQLTGLPESAWTITASPGGKILQGSGTDVKFDGLNPSAIYTFVLSDGTCISNTSESVQIEAQPKTPSAPLIASITKPDCNTATGSVQLNGLPQSNWTITALPGGSTLQGTGTTANFSGLNASATYRFTVNNGSCNSDTSGFAKIDSQPQTPSAPDISSVTQPTCNSASGSVLLSGLPQSNWTITASPGGSTLQGSGSTAIFSGLGQSNTYTFRVSNDICSSESSIPAKINSQPQTPSAPVIGSITQPTCNTSAGAVQLSGLPQANWTITVSPGGATLQGSGINAEFKNLNPSTEYSFIVNNGFCNSPISATVKINSKPIIPDAPTIASISQPTCSNAKGSVQLIGLPQSNWTITALPGGSSLQGSGNTANFSGLNPSVSYSFKVNNGNCISAESSIADINVQPETPTAPTIAAITQPTCSNSKASVQLNGLPSSNWTITASPGGAVLQGSGSNVQFSGLNASTAYSFVVNNGNCSSLTSQVAQINAQPPTPSAPTIGKITQPTCAVSTGSVQLNGLPESAWTITASPGGKTLQGSGSNAQFDGLNPSASYTFVVSDGTCTSNISASAKINAQPQTPSAPLIASITQPDCNTTTGSVLLNGLPQSNWTITASPGGSTLQGSGSAVNFSGLTSSASYTFIVNNGSCNSVASSSAEIITQVQIPSPPIISSITQPSCETPTGKVALDGLPQTKWTITAYPGGTTVQGTGPIFEFTGLNPSTVYKFTVNNKTCTSDTSSLVQINAQPKTPAIPVIEDNFQVAIEGVEVLFHVQNPESEIQYTWNFGDGTPTENSTSAPHTFEKEGVYKVTLKADNGVCSSSSEKEVTVTKNGGTTGLSNNISESDIILYPNPARDFLSVRFVMPEKQDQIVIEIFDLRGRFIMNKKMQNVTEFSAILIPLDNLENGIYQIRFKTRNGWITKPFIVAE